MSQLGFGPNNNGLYGNTTSLNGGRGGGSGGSGGGGGGDISRSNKPSVQSEPRSNGRGDESSRSARSEKEAKTEYDQGERTAEDLLTDGLDQSPDHSSRSNVSIASGGSEDEAREMLAQLDDQSILEDDEIVSAHSSRSGSQNGDSGGDEDEDEEDDIEAWDADAALQGDDWLPESLRNFPESADTPTHPPLPPFPPYPPYPQYPQPSSLSLSSQPPLSSSQSPFSIPSSSSLPLQHRITSLSSSPSFYTTNPL